MSSWRALAEEAARWHGSGRVADLWWRDDDATDAGPALDRLIALHRTVAVPLALAIVPAQATQALAHRLAAEPGIDLMQHGYAHVNHAPPGDKKAELGAHRPIMLVLGELGTGWLALERLFGPRPLAVMVPPWNRVAPGLVPTLPEIGFRGLSVFGPRRARPLRGLTEINAHVDVVAWKAGGGFVGEQEALGTLVAALARARTVAYEPIGLLSHHLAMDGEAWDFISLMWQKVQETPGLRLRSGRQLFAAPSDRDQGIEAGEVRG